METLGENSIAQRRVFVTGGTGYLGQRLIPALLARGHAGRTQAVGD